MDCSKCPWAHPDTCRQCPHKPKMNGMTRELPATYHQRRMLYILTKNSEVWDVPMTMGEAGKRIRELKMRRSRKCIP